MRSDGQRRIKSLLITLENGAETDYEWNAVETHITDANIGSKQRLREKLSEVIQEVENGHICCLSKE